jgi:hypothetical protein
VQRIMVEEWASRGIKNGLGEDGAHHILKCKRPSGVPLIKCESGAPSVECTRRGVGRRGRHASQLAMCVVLALQVSFGSGEQIGCMSLQAAGRKELTGHGS